jgi:hypothetical protein
MEPHKNSKSPPEKPDKKSKTSPMKDKGSSQPPVKKLKVSTVINQVPRSAWQIKGETLRGGFLCFFLQKSLASKLNQQPFIRQLLVRLQKDEQLRLTDMGILFFATRRGPDGQALPSAPNQDDGWCMFLSREQDVGTIGEWLETVEERLNHTTVSENKDIFRWKVTFTCTSWGNQTMVRCLQDVIPDNDVARITTAIHDLTKPKNRMNMENLPLRDYFHTNEEGVQIVQQHLDTILDE